MLSIYDRKYMAEFWQAVAYPLTNAQRPNFSSSERPSRAALAKFNTFQERHTTEADGSRVIAAGDTMSVDLKSGRAITQGLRILSCVETEHRDAALVEGLGQSA